MLVVEGHLANCWMFGTVLETDGSDLGVVFKGSQQWTKWPAVIHVGVTDQNVLEFLRDIVWQRGFQSSIDSEI